MAYVNTPFVKILTGVRRCGKSTILKMIIERLMPKNTFVEVADYLGIAYGKDNRSAISTLADFFGVSKQSVEIRLEECRLL